MDKNNNAICGTPCLKSGDIEIYINTEGQEDTLAQVIKIPGNSRIQIVAHNALLISYHVDMPIAVGDRAISISQTD